MVEKTPYELDLMYLPQFYWRTVGQVNIEMALPLHHKGFLQVMFEKHPKLILVLGCVLCQGN